MAEVLLFHHVQGLTEGVKAFADQLRAAGHTVHVPELLEGQLFGSIAEGVAHVREIGFGTVGERGAAAAEKLGNDLVYAGFSLGVVPAQLLTQTRPGARGALFFSSCMPLEEFGDGTWPDGVPLQVHGMDGDPEFADSGDLEVARAVVEAVDDAELFLYPGKGHLFADSSLPEYDEAAATLQLQRVLEFLARV
ncbi:dienelactone hydrolase family protein [Tenggerimyces flavus]|uniref:Dienelactone hydrolase family protein n=1 Tax=Tenggerimyces flavus TaxID=1708749 RepID=A0ABV7YIQ3_9ACTN|nr:dienelactone hydrolase family protein [Tenggerimyces flavus]MBM7789982.1 dienelactone hydrolase [Tenggerimyces flavus]